MVKKLFKAGQEYRAVFKPMGVRKNDFLTRMLAFKWLCVAHN